MSLTTLSPIPTSIRTAQTLPRPPQFPAREQLTLQLPHFQGKDELVESRTLQSPASWSTAENRLHMSRLERLQEHAQKAHALLRNFSNRHYGALVVLEDGTEGLSVNVEASRQTTLCDLRLAISAAQNNWVQKQPSFAVKPAQGIGAPNVKTIYLVNGDPKGVSPIPCADCQNWLNSDACPPETDVISLESPAQPDRKDEVLIRHRQAKDMLPLHAGRDIPPMVTSKAIASLPVSVSSSAQNVLEQAQPQLNTNNFQKLMKKAKQAYQGSLPNSQASGLPTGTSVLLQPGNQIAHSGRFDWSSRWYETADLKTAALGMEQKPFKKQLYHWLTSKAWLPQGLKQAFQNKLPTQRIAAVAYYGDDPNLPPVSSLGRIARERGSSDTLILTVEHNAIQVRTIADFMPEMYRTKSGKPKQK